ncbi:hypothetical protein F750_6956 [Streptomyces sp. PAMC 26508]|nr:hypothetical protein F750_6956 [Streptomyces sp. PAMC 26508]
MLQIDQPPNPVAHVFAPPQKQVIVGCTLCSGTDKATRPSSAK